MSKKVYLVLTYTSTFLSRLIRVYTRSRFSHISIALTQDLEPMYSFGRRHAYNPFWGGFVKEHRNSGVFKRFPNTKAAVLSLEVSDENYENIKNVLEEMYESKKEFGYDFIGLCLAAIKIEKKRNNKYYCSDFIKSIFQKYKIIGSEDLNKFTEPSDFLNFPGTKIIFEGLFREYKLPQIH